MSESDAPAADWYPDPSGRFQFRYWDGEAWTGHVSTDGKTDWDPPGETAPEDAAAADVAAGGAGDDAAWAPQGDAAAATAASQAPDEDDDDGLSDDNMIANRRAGLDPDVRAWLDEVAAQVEPRLSRINREWTAQPQADAARACAYGLLMGHLAHLHPHMRPELGMVAEAHPSFSTLEAGARLDTLESLAGDAERSALWLGPLIGTEDADRVRMLFD